MRWHWGQGVEFAWVEYTQPLIITDIKQPVILGLFSLIQHGEGTYFVAKRKCREEIKEGEKNLKMDGNCC